MPITDVNFLVGENSTGKTSILGLIEILSGTDIWINKNIDSQKLGFGTFKDIVSVSSADKSQFSIGLLVEKSNIHNLTAEFGAENLVEEGPENDDHLLAFVLTFSEKEGMPELQSMICCRNGVEVSMRFSRSRLYYKSKIVDWKSTAEEFSKSKFLNWVKSHKGKSSGFSILKAPELFISTAPLFVLLSIVEGQKGSPEDSTETVQFEIPLFLPNTAWLAPIRSKPKKTYDEFNLTYSPEGDHTPYLIKKNFATKSIANKFKSFLAKVGENSGLFKEIKIKNYGRGSTVPFELDVVLSKESLSVDSVGYGVSQALPVIVEMFSRPKDSWFSIQQPEVHLHPKAQAALGEIFFNLSTLENKKFIVETHSDYTIDRFRMLLRKSNSTSKSQVLFFERTKYGNKVTPIEIDSNGDFASDQPETYREFFLKEEMNLLGL